ncbi:MAG: serine/threonine-protein kinase [Bacteroidota bacterium]
MNLPPLERWQRLDALLAEALDRPPDERTAFLRARCGGDRALYAEVVALLDAAAAAEDTLGESATHYAAPLLPGLRNALAAAEAAGDLAPGAALGPYRISGVLGRGGMGTVYRAERADGTFDKTVALKVVRRGLDTDDVLARFRRERQVLASLDHPGIARLLDGGATEDGRPYLVMEYVEGEPVTAYADRTRLGVEARLALFAQTGEAVQHAHRRLVVHRDLKPSNVLAAENDRGEPRVKLLDFGIAKLLDPETDGDGLQTQTGLRLLTPAYAAPEQRRGEPVTTATDVYALGVLLFELLTGDRAERDRLAPPSERVTDAAAEAHGTTADRLRRRLRGDLDLIALKALRDDPDRRYPSVEAFLDDVRRHRRGLPVQARPESVAYRARSFVRRHRVGVAAAAAFVALLVGALVAVSLQQRATARERDRAARELAQKQEVVVLLTELLGEADPMLAQGDTLNVYEVLGRAEERLGDASGYAPDVRAHLLHALGHVYLNMAEHDRAGHLLAEAFELRQARYPDSLHADVVSTLELRGRLARDRGEPDRAVALHREAVALRRRLHAEADPALAQALNDLAISQHKQGDLGAADAHFREAIAAYRAGPGTADARLAETLGSLAVLVFESDDLDEAEALLRESIDLLRTLRGDRHPHLASSLNSLGSVLQYGGRLAEAEPLFAEALAINRGAYGKDHPSVSLVLNNLATLYDEWDQHAVADSLYRRVIRADSLRLGPLHPNVAITVHNYGLMLHEVEAYEAAAGRLASAHAAALETLGAEHIYTLIFASSLGLSLADAGRAREAERLLRPAMDRLSAELGAGHWRVAVARRNLGAALAAQGRYDEAGGHLRFSVEVLTASRGADAEATQDAQARLDAVSEALRRTAGGA